MKQFKEILSITNINITIKKIIYFFFVYLVRDIITVIVRDKQKVLKKNFREGFKKSGGKCYLLLYKRSHKKYEVWSALTKK